MATILPFNQIKIGNTVVASPALFVAGSGSVTLNGEDQGVTTADGLVHNIRSALTVEASAELKGDQTALDTAYPATGGTGATAPALPQTIKLQYQGPSPAAAVDIATIEGIISVEHDFGSSKSSVSIKGSLPA